MARIAGVELPEEKKLNIGLTYVYGIGRSNVIKILQEAQVDGDKRIKDLTDEELSKIQKSVDKIKVEGDLKREVEQDIKRLEEINSYRGLRHRKGLTVRGQRTKSNGRTRRGKRKTVGTVRKEVAVKTGGPK